MEEVDSGELHGIRLLLQSQVNIATRELDPSSRSQSYHL